MEDHLPRPRRTTGLLDALRESHEMKQLYQGAAVVILGLILLTIGLYA